MGLEEWMLWIVTETIKYLLITFGVFGFEFRDTKRKYLCSLYLFVGIPVLIYFDINTLLYRTMWGIIIIFVLFKGKIEKKIQAFILEYIMVSIIDLFFWSICINVIFRDLKKDSVFVDQIANACGVFFWLVTVILLRKEKKIINRCFFQMPKRYFFALLSILLGLTVMVGSIQFSLLEENFPETLRRFSLLTGLIVTLLVLIGCIAFIYTLYSKKELETAREIEKVRLDSQQKYYEDVLKKDEGIRQFRHDITKHMSVIKKLCEKNNIEEAKRYVDLLYVDYQQYEVVYTGNIVSDCFISSTIDNLRSEPEFEYKIIGKFPEQIRISNNDLCIVLANALENAQNALKKVDGKKELRIAIKNYKERIFLTIENTALAEDTKNLYNGITQGHGYGTVNMKRVVEKYGGTIEFLFEKNIFTVKIFI